MPDYSKGKIYTIRYRNDDTLIYVGSTVQPLSKRFGGHKKENKRNNNSLIYSTINNDWTDWFIELYQEYPCENKEQLCKREGEVIREIATLNKNIAGRTDKQYRQDNKDKSKEYREQNIDKIKEYQKEYNQANAEKRKEKMKEYWKVYYQKKKLEKQNMAQQN